MTPSLPIRISALAAALLTAWSSLAQASDRDVRRARGQMAAGNYPEARATLEDALAEDREQRAPWRLEAMVMMGGLERSARDAERWYRRVLEADPRSNWGRQAALEIAKIRYATGDYAGCYELLSGSGSCDVSAEACLFEGMAANMLERYRDARDPLGRVRRGKLRTWAYLALAEAELGLDRREDACERYQALASAMISPTALYRYGECLEESGDTEGAQNEYRELVSSFRDTPEAVLAREKLDALRGRQTNPAASSETSAPQAGAQGGEAHGPQGTAVLEEGFTLQFGSFRDRGNAIKLASQIKRVFPGVRIDSDLIRYREYHRVRLGYFKDRNEAVAQGERINRELGVDYTIMSLP